MVQASAQEPGQEELRVHGRRYSTHLRCLLEIRGDAQSKIFPNQAFGYWKIVVERPLRLHSQFTRKAIDSLRFASGDESIRSEIHDQFGDALFEDFGSVRDKFEKWLLEWSKPDENGGDEEVETGAAKPAIPEKRKKKLLDASTWQRDGRLVETATKLQRELGDGLFEDHTSAGSE